MTKSEKYKLVNAKLAALISKDNHLISNFANFVALFKEAFPTFSWIGFYFKEEDELILGPFQGKVACTKIKIGDGVCGTAFQKTEAIIVPNVHNFPGHIACDSGSNSEIVIPFYINKQYSGVLDVDSYDYNNFDVDDFKGLSEALRIFKASVI